MKKLLTLALVLMLALSACAVQAEALSVDQLTATYVTSPLNVQPPITPRLSPTMPPTRLSSPWAVTLPLMFRKTGQPYTVQ